LFKLGLLGLGEEADRIKCGASKAWGLRTQGLRGAGNNYPLTSLDSFAGLRNQSAGA
jgi:hypothetical protein